MEEIFKMLSNGNELHDLFAGSEPVEQSAETGPQIIDTPTDAAPDSPADAHVNVNTDVAQLLLKLHERITRIEQLAQRNGWPL